MLTLTTLADPEFSLYSLLPAGTSGPPYTAEDSVGVDAGGVALPPRI
jgi:hypothetical protein